MSPVINTVCDDDLFSVDQLDYVCDKRLGNSKTSEDQRVEEVSPMNKKSSGAPLCSESTGDCALAGGDGAAEEALSSTHAPSLLPLSSLRLSPPIGHSR